MNGTVDQEALIASLLERLDATTAKLDKIQARLDYLDIEAEERVIKIKVNKIMRQQVYNVISKDEILEAVAATVERLIQKHLDDIGVYPRIEQFVERYAVQNWKSAIVSTVASRLAERMVVVDKVAGQDKPW